MNFRMCSSSIGRPITPGPSSFILRAHSCRICQQLVVRNIGRSRWTGSVWLPYRGELRLSKEDLARGFTSDCLLTRWVLPLLDRSLFTFKSDLGSKGVLRPATRTKFKGTENALDDLVYISSQHGLDCMVEIKELSNGATMAVIGVRFKLDTLLMDRLWDATIWRSPDAKYSKFLEQFASSSMRTSLRVFTLPDDPAANVVSRRPNADGLDSNDSIVLARSWLDECCSSHISCNRENDPLPSRLIDVGTKFPVRSVRLHWTDEEETARYAALTYCWGGPQPLATTRATAQDHTDGISVSRLPQTLLDAITTTIKLGLRYIWIVCLCIIQDDADDVAREIGKMAQIYLDATITISAAGANTVHGGFLGLVKFAQDRPLTVSLEKVEGDQTIPGTIYLQQPKYYSAEEEPISLRAWTLQEHILSQRVLMFGLQDMWWICTSETKSQDGLIDPEENRNYAAHPIAAVTRYGSSTSFRRSKIEAIAHWRVALQDYTRRFLTYPSDKLPAIAGITSLYSELLGSYRAGLWDLYFRSELLWTPKRSHISRPAVLRAPSWSWAAVDGEVTHDWCPPPLAGNIDILGCHVSPISGAPPFGPIDPSKSKLLVRGELAQFYWRDDRQFIFVRRPEPEHWSDKSAIGWKEEVNVASTLADAEEDIPVGENKYMIVWALCISSYPTRGLIFAQVGEDIFRSVGIFYRFFEEDYLPTEKRTIDIV